MMALASCMCIKSQELAAVSPTTQIVEKGVVIKAAVLPSGNDSRVSVED